MLTKPADRELVRELYASGLSTRQVGQHLGVCGTYVHKLCADIARTRSEAAQLRQPPKQPNMPRAGRAQARKMMERHLGRKLIRNEEVHHIDGDWRHNVLSNFELLGSTEHRHLHKPHNPVPRHLRPERKAYMKAYFKVHGAKYYRKRKHATTPSGM